MKSNYNDIVKVIKNHCLKWEILFNLSINVIKLQLNIIKFNSDQRL